MTRAVTDPGLRQPASIPIRALTAAALCSLVVYSRRADAELEAPVPTGATEGAEATSAGAAGASSDDVAPAAEPPATSPAAPPTPASTHHARVVWDEKPSEDGARAPIPATDPDAEPEVVGEFRRRRNWSLSLSLTAESLGGDFDDTRVFVPTNSAGFTLMPRLNPGVGFSVGLGYGATPARVGKSGFWLGVSYSVAWLAGSSAYTPEPPRAVFHALDSLVRFTYRASRRVTPYLQASLGLGFLGLTGTHGAVADGQLFFDDGTVLVLGRHLSMGLGARYQFTNAMSVDASLSYRALLATSVNGQGFEGSLIGHGWLLRAGPAFSF